MRIRMNEAREDRLERLLEATGENTKAIDVAVTHYLNDLQNKREVAPLMEDGLAELLSKEQLPIQRQTNMGRESN